MLGSTRRGWNFLGCVATMVVDHLLEDAGRLHPAILVCTDAFTSALALPAESQKVCILSDRLPTLYSSRECVQTSPRLRIQHIFGEHNVLADAVSRAHWQAVASHCALLMAICPRRVAIPCPALALVDRQLPGKCNARLASTSIMRGVG